MSDLHQYRAKSGTLEPVFTIEIQTVAEDVDRLLDAVMAVHPLHYGSYQRNASVSAQGYETAQPEAGTTTHEHSAGFEPGGTEAFPMVELKISVERDLAALERVMDAVLATHHYEQPVIFVREAFASHSAYNPRSDNPNRWWNNGRGLPDKLS